MAFKENIITIAVIAKTNAKELKVEQLDKTRYRVSVPESPIGGKANKAIIAALAEHFDIAKSRITIIRGMSNKTKMLEIK